MYRSFIKPFFDFIVSLMALIILSPLLIVIIVLLALANKGNPFFIQQRPGLNGEIFKIVKFKTMTDERDNNGNLLSDEVRLTAVGKFVRKTSIDEIPQLFNVVTGKMSIVGPRPLLPEYLSLYTEHQQKRHLEKPGITGWAAVNGRNTISWSQKFDYDVWYVENISAALDMKIIYLTIQKVITSADITAKDHVTMPKFSDEFKNNNTETNI